MCNIKQFQLQCYWSEEHKEHYDCYVDKKDQKKKDELTKARLQHGIDNEV